MKFSIEKSELKKAIETVMPAVSTTNTIEAIKGIRITAEENGSITLQSFDLEKGISCTLPADVSEPGCEIFPAEKLEKIAETAVNGIVKVETESGKATIKSGRTRITIHIISGDQFPSIPQMTGDNTFVFPQAELRASLVKVAYASAVNDTRQNLNGVFVSLDAADGVTTLKTVATDSFRMACQEKRFKCEDANQAAAHAECIVPIKTITELSRLLMSKGNDVCEIKCTKKHFIVKTDAFIMFTRLIDSEYIQYDKFVPKNPTAFITTETSNLKDALVRALLIAEDKNAGGSHSCVKLETGKEVIFVSAVTALGTMAEEVPAVVQSDGLCLGINARYCLEVLKALDSENAHFSLVSANLPVVIRPTMETEAERDEYKNRQDQYGLIEENQYHLIVPVRVRN